MLMLLLVLSLVLAILAACGLNLGRFNMFAAAFAVYVLHQLLASGVL